MSSCDFSSTSDVKVKEGREWVAGGVVGNFDKTKRTGLFVNEIQFQFYH